MRNDIRAVILESNMGYRPCYVKDKFKGLFHRWEEYKTVVEASILVGGAPAGQLSYILGIVEMEDGTVIKVTPENIRFCSGIFKDYDFTMPEDIHED